MLEPPPIDPTEPRKSDADNLEAYLKWKAKRAARGASTTESEQFYHQAKRAHNTVTDPRYIRASDH